MLLEIAAAGPLLPSVNVARSSLNQHRTRKGCRNNRAEQTKIKLNGWSIYGNCWQIVKYVCLTV